MPSIAQAVLEPVCGKKRRREEDAGVSMKLASPHLNRHSAPSGTTQIFNGQIRDDVVQGKEGPGLERRHITPRPLHFHEPSKRQRIERLSSSSNPYLSPLQHSSDGYFIHQLGNKHLLIPTEPISSQISDEVKPKPRADLSPCHICHRKPTARYELNAFADCEGCGKRTCWICIRECLGLGVLGSTPGFEVVGEKEKDPFAFSFERGTEAKGGGEEAGRNWEREIISVHKGMVCSRCCVEKGTEGEVWCLGCLRAEGGD